jgi:hypothetical protein
MLVRLLFNLCRGTASFVELGSVRKRFKLPVTVLVLALVAVPAAGSRAERL